MNPEFRRYVWLELSPLRVWALPLVVFALAVVANAFGSKGPHGLNWDGLRSLGLGIFMVFTVWGGHKAAQSVTSEVVGGTWDLQRLAEHQPSALLVGKLFGSTVYDWLGIACGLGLFAFGSSPASPPGAIAQDVLTLALAALLLHSLALFASLAAAAGLRTTRRPTQGAKLSASLIALVILAFWLGPIVLQSLSSGEVGAKLVSWWWTMPGALFATLSLAMFIGWALLGGHRLIRAELQEPVSPLPWIGFLAFLTLYGYPFVSAAAAPLNSPLAAFCGLAVVVCGGLFYPLLLGERKDVVRLRHLAAAWSRGDSRAVWTRLPLWTFNLAGYALALAGLAVSGLVWPSAEGWILLGVAMSFGFFMLRDLGWILAVHLTPKLGRRPDLVVLFFLAVLYGLVPLLLATLGPSAEPAAYLVVPGLPVVRAAEDAAAIALLAALWALPGWAVAWAIASPRLWRAVRSA